MIAWVYRAQARTTAIAHSRGEIETTNLLPLKGSGGGRSFVDVVMNASFRPSSKYLIVALALFFLGLLMLGAAVSHQLDNDPLDLDQSKWFTGLLGLAGVALSAFMMATCLRQQITISDSTILVRNFSSEHKFDASSVERLVWTPRQLRFRQRETAAKFNIGLCSPNHQLQIIRALRRIVPRDVQEGWAEFCHKTALPLRDGRDRYLEHLPESARVLATRGRWDRIVAYLFLASTLTAVGFWLMLDQPGAFALPLVVLLFWPLIRFSIPKEGRWQLRIFGSRETCEMILALFLCLALSLFVGGVDWTGHAKTAVTVTSVVLAIALMARMLYVARRMDKQRLAWDAAHTLQSVQQWEAGEAQHLPREYDVRSSS